LDIRTKKRALKAVGTSVLLAGLCCSGLDTFEVSEEAPLCATLSEQLADDFAASAQR